MLINEVFDNPYTLKTGTSKTDFLKSAMRHDGVGLNGLMIYEVADDPTQIFILVAANGAWEVHHMIDRNGEITGGMILDPGQGRSGPHPRYLSTAIKLYQTRLDKGHTIRVVAEPSMWPTYSRVIDRMLKQQEGRYIADDVDENYRGIDGDTHIAQVLRPRGKFREIFKNIKSPV
jgi:hypothetical protein